MQTNFSLTQLVDPETFESERVLRTCVHCGFCTATCPTFVLLGDELDSPRGRIYLIKEMLENNRAADVETVKHIDRCLSCLSCMSTCPSGVNYMHLVDHARTHIEHSYRRPLADRWLRLMLALILPFPSRFRLALLGAKLAAPLTPWLGLFGESGQRVAAMLRLAPKSTPRSSAYKKGINIAPVTARRARVALLTGCAQPILRPQINDAAIALLTRLGVEIVLPKAEGCCGALTHHLGRREQALGDAKRNVDAWTAAIENGGLDAIVITASGCGTMIKDYGFMLRSDPLYATKAARISALAKDITEFLIAFDLPKPVVTTQPVIAYHSACSMQHGQKISKEPKQLLSNAGFKVRDIPEGHLCCGSAGTYNILQPVLAAQLRDRKVSNIEKTDAVLVATGNIGCITQISSATAMPVIHTIELLNWAYGGIMPAELARIAGTKSLLAEV
jgi:glycolate oxidase iron-sulfur subunit